MSRSHPLAGVRKKLGSCWARWGGDPQRLVIDSFIDKGGEGGDGGETRDLLVGGGDGGGRWDMEGDRWEGRGGLGDYTSADGGLGG
jgi:hypothetical protein